MLVELGLVEQRYKAVSEVIIDGATVTEVAARYGVVRQTVHEWLVRYANHGLAGLADRSSRPGTCPHQIEPSLEAAIVVMRKEHPGWGPRTILTQLRLRGVDPLPGRSSIHRALLRNGLIDPKARRRRRQDYKRWERTASMDLWQMDVMGRVFLASGVELKVVTGIDDHSRFCVAAKLVFRATARPVCATLAEAMRIHGVPNDVLTDNGKVFTDQFGKTRTEVLFDRICRENGVRHILTKPHSPTTTGKVERFHKTLRAEFLNGVVFDTIEEAQAALDAWVSHYNYERPHQSIGDVPPATRFALARPVVLASVAEPVIELAERSGPPPATRRVDKTGRIGLARHHYHVGRWLAGETVEVHCQDQLVEIFHRDQLVATHVARHQPDARIVGRKPIQPRPVRPGRSAVTNGLVVTRSVDAGGTVSFAGHQYRVGKLWARRSVQVAIVGNEVQLSSGGEVIRTHPIRHDRRKELGAFATPNGRPRKAKAAG